MANMSDSILKSIRAMLFTEETEAAFDPSVIVHINSAINKLRDIGVGPPDFSIADESPTWESYIGDNTEILGTVVEFIYIKVKLVFDPPSSSSMIDILKETLKEDEWRLYSRCDK